MAARRPAFTLLELMIVTGIVATLLALVLPTAAGVMGRLRAMRCQKRLTTLHTCLQQYLADHGDTFPPMQSMGRNDMLIQQMADEAGLTPSDAVYAGGHHWSLFLWPYHRDLSNYVCSDDPRADLRGDLGGGLAQGSPFTDAPPESYALNTLLFRSMPRIRQRAGASWGLKGGEYQTALMFTTRNDQLRAIPALESRILMFCGAAGFTVGHESNVVWRDTGLTPTSERYEWHPCAGPAAFEDAEGFGSNYLFVSGAVEYREDFPSRFEWALDLK